MPVSSEIEPEIASVNIHTSAGDPLDFGSGPRGWLRAGTSFLAVLTMVLIGLQFMLVGWQLDDPDIWWHLRNAAYLFHTHHLPTRDTYSFTVAGHWWVNHEWLSEVPYYLAYRGLGLAGVKVLTSVILIFLFLGLLRLCYQQSRNFKASILACSFATFLATVSYGPRTILFGYFYLVILLTILQRLRAVGNAPLWLIPPLFCLWINTHGSWSLGLIIFALIAASGFIRGSYGRIDAIPWTQPQKRKLLWVALPSVGALFVNPFGWRLVYYPVDLAFNQRLNITHVAEWVTVDFHTPRGKLMLVFLVGVLLAALIRDCRWELGELLIFLFALYSGLTYVRFMFLLAVVAAPILAKTLDFVPRYRPLEDTPKFNALILVAILAALVYFWPTNLRVRATVGRTYPERVMPYLQAHPLDGNLLNFYLWGGYLGWTDPKIKVFVDSRVDIFEYEGVLKDYLSILMLRNPDSIIDKYHIKYVLFPPGEAYTYVLEHDPRWKILYKDNICVLLQLQSNQATVPLKAGAGS